MSFSICSWTPYSYALLLSSPLFVSASVWPARPRPAVILRAGREVRHFTAADDAAIVALSTAGETDQVIARQLGRRQSSIADRRRAIALRERVPVLVIGSSADVIAVNLDAATAGRTVSTGARDVIVASDEQLHAARFFLLADEWFEHFLNLRSRGHGTRRKMIALAGVEEETVIAIFRLCRLDPSTIGMTEQHQ